MDELCFLDGRNNKGENTLIGNGAVYNRPGDQIGQCSGFHCVWETRRVSREARNERKEGNRDRESVRRLHKLRIQGREQFSSHLNRCILLDKTHLVSLQKIQHFLWQLLANGQ